MAWATSDRRRRLPWNWPSIRKAVLDRDGRRCQWRIGGRICGDPAYEVHHIVEAGDGPDDNSPANLIAICRLHHVQATARYAAERRAVWQARKDPGEPKHPGLL